MTAGELAASWAYCADQARATDHGRWLASLFAPQAERRDLWALLAFNAEIARTREVVREPMLGQIRLQWWREAIDEAYRGQVRAHQVMMPLADAIARRAPPRARFETLIGGRLRDLDDTPFESLAALEAYAAATSGSLSLLMLDLLGVGDGAREAAAAIGTAWALVGLASATPHLAARRRLMLPRDLMGAINPETLFTGQPDAALADVVRTWSIRRRACWRRPAACAARCRHRRCRRWCPRGCSIARSPVFVGQAIASSTCRRNRRRRRRRSVCGGRCVPADSESPWRHHPNTGDDMPTAKANGLTIAYETAGDPRNPTILLVMGLGAQLTLWPESFVEALANHGLHVVRYDNRDVGLSSDFDSAGVVDMSEVMMKALAGKPLSPPYTVADMAADGIGLLDALGIGAAHVVGLSMGGMIVPHMAVGTPIACAA